MLSTSALAGIAALVGDPARAGMLAALMDGRALTASELARVAGVSPQTASGHLARMTEAGLLTLHPQGRHRYFRLASSAIAQMLEGLMGVAATRDAGSVRSSIGTDPADQAMRLARTCYDHLAGSLAVAIADGMQADGHLVLSPDGGFVTPSGLDLLSTLGMRIPDPSMAGRRARTICRPCLDWSERRPHIAGAVGAAICQACFERGWVRRIAGTRAVSITPNGRRALGDAFGLWFEPGRVSPSVRTTAAACAVDGPAPDETSGEAA